MRFGPVIHNHPCGNTSSFFDLSKSVYYSLTMYHNIIYCCYLYNSLSIYFSKVPPLGFFSPRFSKFNAQLDQNSTVSMGCCPPFNQKTGEWADPSGSRSCVLFHFLASHRGVRHHVLWGLPFPIVHALQLRKTMRKPWKKRKLQPEAYASWWNSEMMPPSSQASQVRAKGSGLDLLNGLQMWQKISSPPEAKRKRSASRLRLLKVAPVSESFFDVVLSCCVFWVHIKKIPLDS